MLSNVQFSIRVDAEREMLDLLPENRRILFTDGGDAPGQYKLSIRECPSLDGIKCQRGWSVQELNGKRIAVYAPNGKAHFALEYSPDANEATVYVKAALDSFVRLGALYGTLAVLHRECLGLHGVTLECGGETVILSAPSGTGKTTLAGLLEKHCGARVLNGDFALLSVGEGKVAFEPTPFCGSSGVCLNERAVVDRVVFLAQGLSNTWETLNGRQALTSFLSNVFVPEFDPRLQLAVQQNAFMALGSVKTNRFTFEPTAKAAQTFTERIKQKN